MSENPLYNYVLRGKVPSYAEEKEKQHKKHRRESK